MMLILDRDVQPESRSLDGWAQELAGRDRAHTEAQWSNALVRAWYRGTLGIFIESSSLGIPRATRMEIADWLEQRFIESDFDATGLPEPAKPPRHKPGYPSRQAAISRYGVKV